VFGAVLTGWNADQFGRRCAAGSQYGPLLSGGGCGPEPGEAGGVGTLLGPEGADPVRAGARGGGRCLVSGLSGSSYHSSAAVRVCAGGGWGLAGAGPEGGRLVVENCTVDASIFDCVGAPRRTVAGATRARVRARVAGGGGCGVCCGCVAKLLRAHGGCLGTRSR
jgi:hypothetical protein